MDLSRALFTITLTKFTTIATRHGLMSVILREITKLLLNCPVLSIACLYLALNVMQLVEESV